MHKFFGFVLSSLVLNSFFASSATAETATPVKAGWIVQVYGTTYPAKELPECLKDISSAGSVQRHYAKVQFRYVRRMLVTLAEYEEIDGLKPGDRVEIVPADCAAGTLSRIAKVVEHD
ncbi:hypothetical protein ACO0LO_28220 [Undibacterium sp. TJN25]|uniref:hypothetical protein n=1 Tax=Undibacterium sp. TJN25 TaxID=3413056 RepID=UPI003BF3C5A0